MANGGSGDVTITAQEIERAFQALGTLHATLTAAPSTVQPFGSTVLSYAVTRPPTFTYRLALKLAGQAVPGLSGSQSVTIAQATSETFALLGVIPFPEAPNGILTSRDLATAIVQVDAAQCKQGTIAWVGVTSAIRSTLEQMLQGSAFSAPSPPTVTVTDGVLSIDATVKASDGSLEAKVSLGLGQSGGTVVAEGVTVAVHVDASWAADLTGCTSAVQDVSQAFVGILVDNVLVPGIVQQISAQIAAVATQAEAADSQHRSFALTAMTTTDPDNIIFTVCPTTPGSGPLHIGGGLQARAAGNLAG